MTKTRGIISKLTSLILCASFVLVIVLPGMAVLSDRQQEIKLSEKRNLALFPELNWRYETIKLFPQGFDLYFKDNFGFRNKLIKLFNTLQVKWLRQSPVSAVVIGKDGWLFTALNGAMNDYYGKSRPSVMQLETWRQTLEIRKKWFAQLGIEYYFFIAPNKHTIYPEFLPKFMRQAAGETRRAAIITYFDGDKRGPLIDLSEPLLSAKKLRNVYHRTDTHWNEYGAYVAARNIAEEISGKSNLMDSMSPVEHSGETKPISGDLANYLGLEDLYNERVAKYSSQSPCAIQVEKQYPVNTTKRHTAEVFTCENAPIKGKALVVHDSFGRGLKPYLSEYFSETVYIGWGGIEQYQYILASINPDYVIDERAERNLEKALVRDIDTEISVYEDKFNSPERTLFELSHESYEHQIKKFQRLKHWLHEGKLALELLDENATIDIDYALPGEGKNALLKLVVSSSTESWFSAHYRENDPAGTGILRKLKPGLNAIYVSIPPQQIEGPVQLGFKGTDYYIIHALEIIEH